MFNTINQQIREDQLSVIKRADNKIFPCLLLCCGGFERLVSGHSISLLILQQYLNMHTLSEKVKKTSFFEGHNNPLIISGPCSAESETQLLQTAHQLQALQKVDIFRAGIWKPRTRPNEFEGVGTIGLQWMQKVKQETGFKLVVEVAKPEHVEEALHYGSDALWIGARTVVNPFSVQELAASLKGVDIPIFVKNPLTPDLKLWIGAIERFQLAGINQLAAIHRGFHYFANSPYRNAPMWEIPIELKRLFPDLPLITDISHISGKRSLLQEIAQKALDLETDGLMVESHFDPDSAKTDAAQQITPFELGKMLDSLRIHNPAKSENFALPLEKLRTEIDKLDGELLFILAKRMEIIDEIGAFKKANKHTILQHKRSQHIIEDRLAIGSNLGLDQNFLNQLIEIVNDASAKRQKIIFNKPQAEVE